MDVSPPETFLISERVFLAFDTERGVACVQASGWRRAYLLWTFRNFRGLPHKILNAQQRKLVEALYSEASLNPAGGLAQERLIGTVQDLRLPSSEPVKDSATEPFTSNLHPDAPKTGSRRSRSGSLVIGCMPSMPEWLFPRCHELWARGRWLRSWRCWGGNSCATVRLFLPRVVRQQALPGMKIVRLRPFPSLRPWQASLLRILRFSRPRRWAL